MTPEQAFADMVVQGDIARDKLHECGADSHVLVRNDLVVGIHFDAVDDKRPFQGRFDTGGVERHGTARRGVDDERLARRRFAHEQPIRPNQIG